MPAAGFAFGPFHLDPRAQELRKNGELVLLPTSQFRLLVGLVSRAGDVASKNDLIETGWQGAAVADSSLTQAVSSLRSALGPGPPDGYIVAVHGHGYLSVTRMLVAKTRLNARDD
jgi:DNA-binding winged helix-turn-helix (wHTH) protein